MDHANCIAYVYRLLFRHLHSTDDIIILFTQQTTTIRIYNEILEILVRYTDEVISFIGMSSSICSIYGAANTHIHTDFRWNRCSAANNNI